MKGSVKTINSISDFALSDYSDEDIIKMATHTIRYDDADYGDDYDTTLTEGDDGYIAPIYRYEEEVDQNILDRFDVKLK